MKQTLKRTGSFLLAMILLFGMFSVGSEAFAAESGYQVGDIVEFGVYPQTQVTDDQTLRALDALDKEWISYNYVSAYTPSDYMRYADLELDGVRYRAVTFDLYRPYATNYKASTFYNTNQGSNGYLLNTVYYFRFEPLRWVILDESGLMMTEYAIDAQAYFGAEPVQNPDDGFGYQDATYTHYASYWPTSDACRWLNDTFYGTAFDAAQSALIRMTAKVDSYADSANEPTYGFGEVPWEEKVFLLSQAERSDASKVMKYFLGDSSYTAYGTDYAFCQGLGKNGTDASVGKGKANAIWTRTQTTDTHVAQIGTSSSAVGTTGLGIRPAIHVDLSSLSAAQGRRCGGVCTENMTWYFENGNLQVTGYGQMPSYGSAQQCPWNDLRADIRTVTVQNKTGSVGVNSVSAYAFQDCPQLGEVFLPSSVRKVGVQAFDGCDRLHHVTALSDLLSANDAFPQGKDDLLFYCPSQTVRQTVESMGYRSAPLSEQAQVLSVPGTITINAEHPYVHLKQWIDAFSDNQWIHFDTLVFEGVSAAGVAQRNRALIDETESSLTLRDFYLHWFTLAEEKYLWTFDTVLQGLRDAECAAFTKDLTFGKPVVEFGAYPQTEVTDAALVQALNACEPQWISYGYYSGDGTLGSMQAGDFMQYADVTYRDCMYRGVKIIQYRPYSIFQKNPTPTQGQTLAYPVGTYWFRYEPLTWRVLDAQEGLLLCESVLDSQPFQNTYYSHDETYYTQNDIPFPNNYAQSSVRQWLNETFYGAAFTAAEQTEIQLTLNETPDRDLSDKYSNFSMDKVFLPSFEEMTDASYGFLPAVRKDPARGSKDQWTDYSKSQGAQLLVDFKSASSLILRTASKKYVQYLSEYGEITYAGYAYNLCGVRPAMRVNPQYLKELLGELPVSGSCGENVRWTFDEESGVLSLDGVGAMETQDSFAQYGYSCWKDAIRFVVAADGVTSIGASAFEGCPVLEEVILGEDVSVIGEAAFQNCPQLMNVTLLGHTVSAQNAFPSERTDWTLIYPSDNAQAQTLAQALGVSGVPFSYGEDVLSFDGTITVHDGFAYTYLPTLVQRYDSAQKVCFHSIVFADVASDSVEQQDYTGEQSGCLVMNSVEITLLYISPDGEQTQVTYAQMIELLQSGDYRAFKLRIQSDEKTQEEIIAEKIEKLFPFLPKKVLRVVSKAINFIVRIFKKKK